MALRLKLPSEGMLRPIGGSDPLRYYYKPIIGRLFRGRIDLGLSLLEGRFKRLLEVGYGSGLLLPTLCEVADEIYGADVEPEPEGLRDSLRSLGVAPRELVQADVRQLPFPDAHFDAVVAFSILEHLRYPALKQAADEIARVLRSGGCFLVGCPAVHKAMSAAFAAIGFRGIDEHHFSDIREVVAACAPSFVVSKKAGLPRAVDWALPFGWAPYAAVLMIRK